MCGKHMVVPQAQGCDSQAAGMRWCREFMWRFPRTGCCLTTSS